MMRDSIYEEKIDLRLKQAYISAAPGVSAAATVVLTNLGSQDDYFEISVKGVPAGWVSMDTSVIHLNAGEVREHEVTFQPSEHPQLRAGVFPFTIQVVNQRFPDESAEASGALTVARQVSSSVSTPSLTVRVTV